MSATVESCTATLGAGAAAALLVVLPGASVPEVLLAAGLWLALAGLLDRISRPKKPDEPPRPDVNAAGDGTRGNENPPAPGSPAPDGPVGNGKPGGKKKDDAPPRPKPRRSDYKGNHVRIFVPGRTAPDPSATPVQPAPPEPPAPQAGMATSDGSACPGCGRESGRPGGRCSQCECEKRVAEVSDLVGSLRTREVNVLPAERYLFQARSALAVSAWKDVERLVDQAEALAREQEADFEEAAGLLARCEETIAAAAESGRNILAAERALRRATMLFKDGKYTDSMEEAVLVPTLILDRPRPRIVSAATSPEAGPEATGEGPDAMAAPEAGERPGGADAVAPMVRCPGCGERVKEGTETCPACGRQTLPGGPDSWAEGRSCLGCGESLEPGWKVCPACNTPVAGEQDPPEGTCPSCGREVLPTWTACPFCDARLRSEEAAMKVRKGFSRPEKPAPEIPPALREKGVLAQIEEVDRLLDEAGRRDIDVRKARNLLELAVNFTRSGNYDKGERYVRKSKNVAETLLSME